VLFFQAKASTRSRASAPARKREALCGVLPPEIEKEARQVGIQASSVVRNSLAMAAMRVR
jgi:hypothetical protein